VTILPIAPNSFRGAYRHAPQADWDWTALGARDQVGQLSAAGAPRAKWCVSSRSGFDRSGHYPAIGVAAAKLPATAFTFGSRVLVGRSVHRRAVHRQPRTIASSLRPSHKTFVGAVAVAQPSDLYVAAVNHSTCPGKLSKKVIWPAGAPSEAVPRRLRVHPGRSGRMEAWIAVERIKQYRRLDRSRNPSRA
jgi:hypothetical protein